MRVAITRPRSPLTDGWLAIPVTSRTPIESGLHALKETLYSSEDGMWLAVTSPHTFRVLRAAEITIPAGIRIACVGDATAQLSPRTPDFIGPSPASAQSFVAAVPAGRDKVVFPSSNQASQVLEVGLRQKGYSVDRFDVYSTEADPGGVKRLASANAQAIVVTASSAALAIADHWPGGTDLPPLIALGEPTAHTLQSAGIPAAQVSTTPDRAGLGACFERI